MVVLGGLNPIAALEEANIETENMAMSIMMEYSKLVKLK
jgi:repressor of nif and glnA expression